MWHMDVYTMGYAAATEKNERMPFAATQIYHGVITLSEKSQKENAR